MSVRRGQYTLFTMAAPRDKLCLVGDLRVPGSNLGVIRCDKTKQRTPEKFEGKLNRGLNGGGLTAVLTKLSPAVNVDAVTQHTDDKGEEQMAEKVCPHR